MIDEEHIFPANSNRTCLRKMVLKKNRDRARPHMLVLVQCESKMVVHPSFNIIYTIIFNNELDEVGRFNLVYTLIDFDGFE